MPVLEGLGLNLFFCVCAQCGVLCAVAENVLCQRKAGREGICSVVAKEI